MASDFGPEQALFDPTRWWWAKIGDDDAFPGRDDYDPPGMVLSGKESRIMWVYRMQDLSGAESGSGDVRYQVGYYDPRGEWHADLSYGYREDAVSRVNYLNGGARQDSGR